MANIAILLNIQLLDVRLLFHFVAFLHLFITALVTLSIDPSVDEDHRVKAYAHLRWKLLTFWYNVVTLAYLPLCVYWGCKEKRGLGYEPHVRWLRYVTDVLMTGIIFPIAMCGGILFWLLMTIDGGLIAPPKLFDYMPYWCQHSLHSVSMAVVLVDLLITPRTRPKSLVPRFLLATGFSATYILAVYISYLHGDLVYSCLEIFSAVQTVVFTLLCYLLCISFYLIQWKIIYFVWRHKVKVKKKLKAQST